MLFTVCLQFTTFFRFIELIIYNWLFRNQSLLYIQLTACMLLGVLERVFNVLTGA